MTQLQPTGLITSGPLGSSAGSRSGSGKKPVYGPAVTNLNGEVRLGFKVSKAVMWVVFVAAVMVVVVGAFLMVAVERKEVVVVVVAAGGVLAVVVAMGVWNCAWKEKGLVGSLRRYPDDELRGAVDGQYVKVTGVISLSLCAQTYEYLLGVFIFSYTYSAFFFCKYLLNWLVIISREMIFALHNMSSRA